jgi:hypothetical protein
MPTASSSANVPGKTMSGLGVPYSRARRDAGGGAGWARSWHRNGAPCLSPLSFVSHDYGDFHLLMPLYLCRKCTGIPAPQEGQALKWVMPRRLTDYPMPPADRPLVTALTELL